MSNDTTKVPRVFSFSVGSQVYSFSLIPGDKEDDKVRAIIEGWKRAKTYKKDIKAAVLLYHLSRNPGEKMTAYMTAPSGLSLLPPAWDLWQAADVKPLNAEDLLKLFKVMLENTELVRRQLESVNSMK